MHFRLTIGLSRSGLPRWLSGKKSAYQCRRPMFHPWVRTILWRRKWHPTPVLLPGKSHGQRSLVSYSPWGHKESDATEQTHTWANWLLGMWPHPKLQRIVTFVVPPVRVGAQRGQVISTIWWAASSGPLGLSGPAWWSFPWSLNVSLELM